MIFHSCLYFIWNALLVFLFLPSAAFPSSSSTNSPSHISSCASQLVTICLWYPSSTHHGACAPWRGVHWSDHFISKCEKWFIVMCKHWNLPPVLTLAQHKYITVRTEWMWVYLKYWKKGKIISANYVLKECTFSTFSMLVLMAKSGIWCFSNLGKL